MKKLGKYIFFGFSMFVALWTGAAFAESNCSGWSYYDSDSESCVSCENNGFTITTSSLASNTEFWFTMSPKGSFAVDWGDGVIDNIDRDNTTATDYTHTYTNGGGKTIKFCGHATENGGMFIGAFVPLEERDKLYGARGEQGVGSHRHESEIVVDVCVQQ